MSEGRSRIRAAIQLSPLCRITEFNLAEDIINTGLSTGNCQDFQQQVLGIKSSNQTNSLTLEILKNSIESPPAERRIDTVFCGVDQGRGQHWIWIAGFSLPVLWYDKPTQVVIDSTVRTVLLAKDVIRTEIPDLLEAYSVEFGLTDGEPDITDAAELARCTVLQLADQKTSQLDDVKLGQIQTGGLKHDAWFIKNGKFLKAVLDSFLNTDDQGYPLQRLPKTWDIWFNNPSELSPLRHLTGPSYDPDSGRWTRGDGNIDDLYYACMFCEAAFYIWLTQNRVKNEPPTQIGQAQKRVHRISQR